MSNKVDKLFKDKLEGDSLQPSARAWEKVEAHLGKKNKIVLWARVAAAIAVLGLLTFVGINWDNGRKREIVKQEMKKQEPEQTAPVVEQRKEELRTEPGTEESKSIKKQKPQPKLVTPIAEQPTEQMAIVPEPQLELRPNVVETELTARNSQPTTQKGITLTYSLPALKKQDAPAEPLVAEQKEQKKTGFERVIEIAKEVKTGDALGELRQAKDDIFALDFRKDKKNKQ